MAPTRRQDPGRMDITHLFLTLGSVAAMLLVAAMAVLPVLLEVRAGQPGT